MMIRIIKISSKLLKNIKKFDMNYHWIYGLMFLIIFMYGCDNSDISTVKKGTIGTLLAQFSFNKIII